MIFFELLNQLHESKTLVDIRRDDLNVDDIRGFILGTSAKFVLIGLVSDDIQHNGFTIIETDSITFLRWGTDYQLAWEKALEEPSGHDRVRDIDLTNWWGVIAAARLMAPLVSFFRERLDPTVVYISDQFHFSDDSIVGRQISTEGQRNGSFAMRTNDLTRIDFCGRYESGLKRMLESI
jgi:hypothetical protein